MWLFDGTILPTREKNGERAPYEGRAPNRGANVGGASYEGGHNMDTYTGMEDDLDN